MRERFRENINSYSQNDPFNLLSAVRAKYGEVVVSELLESIEDFIEQELKKEREEIVEIVNQLRYKYHNAPNDGDQYTTAGYEICQQDVINIVKNRT